MVAEESQSNSSDIDTRMAMSANADIIDNGTGVEQEIVDADQSIIEPFDPKMIRVETRPSTIDLLLARVKHGELNLAPGFQRKAGIWKEAAQSKLIESILIRIPLPAFYIDATDDERWLVVDGLQRLTALKRFVLEESLKLTGLEFLSDLHGKTYNNLPRSLQRRIDETQVTVYLIEKGTPPAVKFNIFKRINTGGLPLSAQEIRHALNQGQASDCLVELADSKEFKAATNNGVRDERMTDRECVLRCLAFMIVPYTEYKVPDLDNFLNNTMAAMNKMPKHEVDLLKYRFTRTMTAASLIFGPDAFRKRLHRNDARKPINRALFEAWSVNLDRLTDEQLRLLEERKDQVIDKFSSLMRKPEFDSAISQGTGDINRVRVRFGMVHRLIVEVLE